MLSNSFLGLCACSGLTDLSHLFYLHGSMDKQNCSKPPVGPDVIYWGKKKELYLLLPSLYPVRVWLKTFTWPGNDVFYSSCLNC